MSLRGRSWNSSAMVFLLTGATCLVSVQGASQTSVSLKKTGTVTPASISASKTTTFGNDPAEIRPEVGGEINRLIPHSSFSAARVPADHAPDPPGSAIVGSNPGFTGFTGLTHLDQRLAGSGNYTNTQFSTEPPDQGLCVGNGFVLETVNTALRIHDVSGNSLTAAIPLNQFFGLAPGVIRSNPLVFGDFVGDPRCYYDAPTQRWFVTSLQLDIDSSTGSFTGRSHLMIAVSNASDPTLSWNIYSLDVSNDGQDGTPSHAGCPCFGDQPLIGADANGFYISTNEFVTLGPGFHGEQLYAISKTDLEAGGLPPVVSFDVGAMPAPDGGIWYSLFPAVTPPGDSFETGANGTEYLLSSLDFSGTLDNRIALWALTNTASLNGGSPDLHLVNTLVDSEVYGDPPAVEQKAGPLPLATSLGIPKQKLELLDGSDDRMQQVVYASGMLWAAIGTRVKTQNGPARAGIAYMIVQPSIASQGNSVGGTVVNQGYVAVNLEHVTYPSVGVNSSGNGAIVFTLTGPDYYPSTAYVALDAANGAGDIHIAARGALPEDGFTGYVGFDAQRAPRTARWGDYSAATADESGDVWIAGENIPNLPRTLLANWGTSFGKLVPGP